MHLYSHQSSVYKAVMVFTPAMRHHAVHCNAHIAVVCACKWQSAAQVDCLMLAMVCKPGPQTEKLLMHRSVTDNGCLAYRVTRFDKDDTPDFSQLGQSRNERYGSKFDAYGSRPDGPSNRETYRQSDHTDNSFSAVRERVQMGIATSHSHTEALQDLVLSLSEGTSRRDAESDKSALKELVKEMLTFRCSPFF